MQTDIFEEIEVSVMECRSIKFDEDFENEADFTDWIELNIEAICEDHLDVDYESHIKEYYHRPLEDVQGRRRVDFMIRDKQGKFTLIECKVPKRNTTELVRAIGQLMAYVVLFQNEGLGIKNIILLSTKYCPLVPRMIAVFNLPINFIVMDKSKRLKTCLPQRETNMQ